MLAGEENPQIIKQMLFIISVLMHSYNGKDTSGCTDILAYMITLFKDCKILDCKDHISYMKDV